MKNRKQLPLMATIVAAIVVVTAVLLVWRLWNGDSTLLRNVSVQHAQITPNADGDTDATLIEYELSRNATVSIYFEDEAGSRYYFRQNKPRGAGQYKVAFSGVVDGYTLPGEQVEGEILARLLRDGRYTMTIAAEDGNGRVETWQGTLQIADADPVLPEIRNFSVFPDTFTPNRDGIDDRLKPQFSLTKEVESVRVFLLVDGEEVPVSEQERDIPPTDPGLHIYDYDGGVDDGATPPPDGTYPIVVVVQDTEGQRMRVEDEITIQFGGVPRARIVAPPTGRTLEWNTTAVSLCDTLTFTITVENYGTTPLRTSGPAPGTEYDSDWNYNTLGWFTESGVFRLGIGFENELTNYPFRWAIGSPEDLEMIDGRYYLMPGERAVVTGSIRVVDVFGDRNPQPVWAGLIHEDVQVEPLYSRVDPQPILVDIPDEAHRPTCEAREPQMREMP